MAAAVETAQSEVLDCTTASTAVNFTDTSRMDDSSASEDGGTTEETDKSSADDTAPEDSSLLKSDKSDEEMEKSEDPPAPELKKVAKEEKAEAKKRGRKSGSDKKPPPARTAPAVSSGRERKQVERFVSEVKESKPTAEIVAGRGDKLSDIPSVAEFITKKTSVDLADLHYICYGSRAKKAEVKSRLRNFSGFPFDEGSKEYEAKKTALTNNKKYSTPGLKKLCADLGISGYGGSKSHVVDALLQFCLKPEGTDLKPKTPKSKTKASSKRKSSAKAKKSDSKKPKKSASKKRKRDDSSNEESEVEDEEKGSDSEEAEPPAKKSRKAEPKKSPAAKKAKIPSDSEDEEKSDSEKSESSGSDYGGEKSKKKKAKKAAPPKKNSKKVAPPKKTKGKPQTKKKEEASDVDSSDEDKKSNDAKNVGPTSDADIKKTIARILETVDMSTFTMKMVLQKIQEKYPDVSIEEKKPLIKEYVDKMIEELEED